MILRFPYSPVTFFDVTPMLLVFEGLGRWLEHIAKQRATRAFSELVGMQPTSARVCTTELDELARKNLLKQGIIEGQQLDSRPIRILSEEIIDVDLLQRADIINILPGMP